MIRRALLLPLLLAVGACALRPVYGGGGEGVAATTLAHISVAPIPDQAGFLVRQALMERIGEPETGARYRLEVALDDSIIGFGIRGDDSIARERRILRARYRLVSLEDGSTLFEATAGSDAGIDVVRSDYAVVAAENTALERLATQVAEQITARLAAFALRAETE